MDKPLTDKRATIKKSLDIVGGLGGKNGVYCTVCNTARYDEHFDPGSCENCKDILRERKVKKIQSK